MSRNECGWIRMDRGHWGVPGGLPGPHGPPRGPPHGPKRHRRAWPFWARFWTLGARCAERLAWPVLSRPDLALTWPDLDLRGDRDVFSQL